MPEIYKQLGKSRAPFDVYDREARKKRLGYKPDIVGLCTRDDQVLDAGKSLQLYKMGIKVRVPLKGFYLDSLETEEGVESAASLQARGLIDQSERPYMSYWAMETLYRVDDLMRAVADMTDSELRGFLINATRYTANNKEETYKVFRDNFTHLIENQAPTTDLLELWTNFILDTCKRSFDQLRFNKVIHHNFHAQNVTLHGEICDNSEITIANDESQAIRAHKIDISNFFDSFSNVWLKYCEKNIGVDNSACKERFEQRIDEFF